MHTLHLGSPAPSPSLPASAFPFFPLGTFSRFFAGAFLGLGSGFGGAGLADNLADLLCGSSFTLGLSPLASPSAFLLGMVVSAATVAGRRRWAWDAAARGLGRSGGRSRLFFFTLLPWFYFICLKDLAWTKWNVDFCYISLLCIHFLKGKIQA